jgi:hypothetical protein
MQRWLDGTIAEVETLMRSLLLLGLAALLLPTAASAYKERSGDHSAVTDPNKVICRTDEVIGSRLQTEKTCHTAQEWAQYERDVRLTTDRIQAMKTHQGN